MRATDRFALEAVRHVVLRRCERGLIRLVVIDDLGESWRATEDALVADSPSAEPRPRLPAQRAFWFGWQAQFPTRF